MILLSRNKIKRNGCWSADFHFRAVVSRLATPECQTLSPPLPSTSPCPSWQLLAYRPIQRVMRKLTDRFLSSRWKKAQTSLWGTELHSAHVMTEIFQVLMAQDQVIILIRTHYFDYWFINQSISSSIVNIWMSFRFVTSLLSFKRRFSGFSDDCRVQVRSSVAL